MATLTPSAKQQFFDANGNPLAGGKLYTYAAGTTTPLATYTDSSGGTPNTNPVILDSRGEASIWLGVASYKLKLTTAANVEIWTVDNIVSASVQALANLSESGGSALVGYLPAGTGAVATTVQAKLRETVSVKDFGAVGDGITNDTAAIQAAINASYNKTLLIPYGTYLVTGDTLAAAGSIRMMGDAGAVLKLKTSANSDYLLSLNSAADDFVFDNITFDVNQPTSDAWTNTLVQISAASRVRFIGCKFINSASSAFGGTANNGYGIYLLGAYDNICVEDCYFERHKYGVITEPSSTGKDITVRNSSFFEMAGDGVEINVPTGSCDNVLVDGCTFRSLGSNSTARGFGVGASGAVGSTITDLMVTNSSFYACDNQAIHVEDGCKRVVLSHNYIQGCGAAAATSFGSGIYVAASVASNRAISDVIIDGNVIVGAAGSDYGIFVAGAYVLNGLAVINNSVSATGNGPGIVINSANAQATVNNNKVKNSTGVGIRYNALSGTLLSNFCWDDQAVKTQTYGIELQSDAAKTSIRDNNISDNINKGFLFTTLTFPKQINSDQIALSGISAGAAAYSSWVDVIYLGIAASGTVYVNFVRPSERSTGLFTVSWNGTTLTGSNLNIQTLGNIAISGTFANALQMNGNWLQARVYNAGGSVSDITLEVSFNGAILAK